MEERVQLNPKKKDHGHEENSAVVTQVKKNHYKHVGILSGKVKERIKEKGISERKD